MGIGRVGTAPPRPASHYLYKSNPKDHRPRFPLIITDLQGHSRSLLIPELNVHVSDLSHQKKGAKRSWYGFALHTAVDMRPA